MFRFARVCDDLRRCDCYVIASRPGDYLLRKKITKRSVDNLAPRDRDYFIWDTDLTGFGCKVTPAGRRVYVLQYRLRHQHRKTPPKRLTLGKHGELTPDKARKLAAELLINVKAGEDPALLWKRSDAVTVADLMDRFLEDYLPNKKRPPKVSTVRSYDSLNRCHIVPVLGKKRVTEVARADLERMHRRMRATPYVANRTLTLLQHAFDLAEAWGWRPQATNPAKGIERYPERRRGARKEVMLTAKQMRRLLKAIDKEQANGASPAACDAIRVAFWTGWRIGEVLALEWDNLDLERGVARLVDTKTSEEEYRQIPAEVIEILEGIERVAGCPFVFPGRNLQEHLTTVKKPWHEIRKRARLHSLDGLGALRIHDLRHNVVSWDVSRGVPLEIAGKNVGHRSRQATEIYEHFAPDALKRAADARTSAMRAAVEAAGD